MRRPVGCVYYDLHLEKNNRVFSELVSSKEEEKPESLLIN